MSKEEKITKKVCAGQVLSVVKAHETDIAILGAIGVFGAILSLVLPEFGILRTILIAGYAVPRWVKINKYEKYLKEKYGL